MRQRFSLVLTLFAWLLATGGQWDLVQTFAWSRMMVSYAESMPLAQAVEKTFSGEQCSICMTVQEAKRDQTDHSPTAIAKTAGKVVLVCPPQLDRLVKRIETSVGLVAVVPELTSADRSAPPSPPPRAAA